jgi:hypothetical protein
MHEFCVRHVGSREHQGISGRNATNDGTLDVSAALIL